MNTPAPHMRALRFHAYGEPADVLRLDNVAIPTPGENRIRIRVHACGLNPADWALCEGLFAGDLPRGVGLDVAGIVDAVGSGVVDVKVGDAVLGMADFINYSSAGLSDYTIMNFWTPVPPGLDLIKAAALSLATETAFRSVDVLGVRSGQTVVINGAGSMVGYAAVQIAIMRGARVIATASDTFAERLRALGANVTSYGDGMADRVREIAGGASDLALDYAPPGGALPVLVDIVGGDPKRVMTVSDFAAAAEIGTQSSGREGTVSRYDVVAEFAQLAAEGRFDIPIGRTFALTDWHEAVEISRSRRAQGKLMVLPEPAIAER